MIDQKANFKLKNERKLREKIFHDEVFVTNIRRKLSIFYSINESVYKESIGLLSECTSKRVLEIGCGLGSYAIRVALKETNVSAIDVSDYAIKEAQKRADNENLKIDFRIMDAENLEFRENEFDLVYGIAILHHLNLKVVIPEIRRVLKSSGKAIFSEPMGHNPFINAFRFLTPQLRLKDEHPLRMKDLHFITRKFTHFEIKFYYFLTLFAVPFYKLFFFDQIKYFLEELDRKIFIVMPWFRQFAWRVLLILEK